MGCRTVVSWGRRCRATGMSLKPVTATSLGTSMPRWPSAYTTPSADWSFAHAMASGRTCRAARRPTPAHHPPRALVVRARDGIWQDVPGGQQPVDDAGAARCGVTVRRGGTALPLRAVHDGRAALGDLGLEGRAAGQVVGAVNVAAQVGKGAVAVVTDQVASQVPHARRIVAVHVGGALRGTSGEGDDRDLPGEPLELTGIQHPVVQDQAVALTGQGEDPPAVVVVVHVDGADQQVVVAALGGNLDASVDEVGELQALLFVLDRESAVLDDYAER